RTIFVRSARIGRDKVYGYPDDAKRYALFCRAVLADLVDRPPDVVHAHDWHAALLVPMVGRAKQLRGSGTAFTIHNLAYQGRTSASVLRLAGLPRSRLPVEARDECNPMARAIASADIVSTVSERYAEEILTPEFGEGLEGLLAQRRADLWGITNGIDAALAQRIYAGADLFLMPSRFEPCGLGQLISLRYGTIPVVRAVGGLADTVRDLDTDPRRGNGFSFATYDPAAFADAVER